MKYLKLIRISAFLTLVLPLTTLAATAQYVPLAPISGFIDNNSANNLSTYLNNLFRLGVAVATGLAVVMIVIGGIQYLSTDAISGKSEGKEKVTAALWGLLIALGSYALLNTINPQLLNTNLVITPVRLNVTTPQIVQYTPGGGTPLQPDQLAGANQGNYATDYNGVTSGRATSFGYNDSQDNGVGNYLLDPTNGGGIGTDNTTIQGVAIPASVLESTLGVPPYTGASTDWANWAPARNAAVEVFGSDPSQPPLYVPIVDLGPGSGPQSKGVVVDETYAVNQYFGGDGNRSYKIIPNYYNRPPGG